MPEEENEGAQQSAGKKGKLMTIIVVAGLMLVEGVGIFAAVKFLGSDPAPAEAGTGEGEGEGDGETEQFVELAICEIAVFNKREGRLNLYNMEVLVLVLKEDEERLLKLIGDRANTIKDRIGTVIRAADPKYLNEPGLETIRRQIKFQLDKVLGDEKTIREVLIPKLMQSQGSL